MPLCSVSFFRSLNEIKQIHLDENQKQEWELFMHQLKSNEWAVAFLCVLCSLS